MFIVISAISCYAFSTVKDPVVGAGVVLYMEVDSLVGVASWWVWWFIHACEQV